VGEVEGWGHRLAPRSSRLCLYSRCTYRCGPSAASQTQYTRGHVQ
jgi:hypothetical protein